jgi:hypothetical protein
LFDYIRPVRRQRNMGRDCHARLLINAHENSGTTCRD